MSEVATYSTFCAVIYYCLPISARLAIKCIVTSMEPVLKKPDFDLDSTAVQVVHRGRSCCFVSRNIGTLIKYLLFKFTRRTTHYSHGGQEGDTTVQVQCTCKYFNRYSVTGTSLYRDSTALPIIESDYFC